MRCDTPRSEAQEVRDDRSRCPAAKRPRRSRARAGPAERCGSRTQAGREGDPGGDDGGVRIATAAPAHPWQARQRGRCGTYYLTRPGSINCCRPEATRWRVSRVAS